MTIDAGLARDVAEFLEAAGPFLAAEPFLRNIIATTASAAHEGKRYPDAGWCIVTMGRGEVVGAAMHTPPYGVALSDMSGDAAAAVADAMHRAGRRLPGASGPGDAVDAFARRWEALSGATAEPLHAMGVFALGELVQPPRLSGYLRPVVPADAELVTRWLLAFHDDAGLAPEQREGAAERLLARPVYLWEDAGPACLVSHSTGAAGVARIGPVYTPPERRRRGYAAAATAAVSRLLLDAGLRCMLFTDLANPTSNGVYTRIGYRRVADAIEVRFVAA